MSEPRWVERRLADGMHLGQIQTFGGSHGIRDAGLIDSALARPRNKCAYGKRELAPLAAAYAFGLANNQGYVDGNKRIAFLAMATFLELNGLELDPPESEVVRIMLRVANGSCSEEELAEWVRNWARPISGTAPGAG